MGRTFLQQKQEVARKVRMNLNDTDQNSAIEYWLNEGQAVVCREQGWWFNSFTFSFTPSTTERQYPFPSVDIDGNSRIMASLDTNSVRTISKPLYWTHPTDIDRDFENWANTTDTGSPTHWTVEGQNISLNRIPSQDWIDTHVKVMFRGFPEFSDMSADGDESIIPNNWRNIIEVYAESHGHERQGDESMANQKRAEFRVMLEEMVAKCRGVHGKIKGVRAPTIFNLPSRRAGRAASVRR